MVSPLSSATFCPSYFLYFTYFSDFIPFFLVKYVYSAMALSILIPVVIRSRLAVVFSALVSIIMPRPVLRLSYIFFASGAHIVPPNYISQVS